MYTLFYHLHQIMLIQLNLFKLNTLEFYMNKDRYWESRMIYQTTLNSIYFHNTEIQLRQVVGSDFSLLKVQTSLYRFIVYSRL